MNDDELGLRLRGELHERINPPDRAPEPLHEHVRHLRSMEPVRFAARRSSRMSRQLVRLAAVAAACALVAAGLLLAGPLRNGPSTAGPNSTFSFSPGPSAVDVTQHVDIIEGGARLDDKTGWVVISRPGGNRYVRVTQDGGATWSKAGEIGGNARDIGFVDASYGWMVSQASLPGVVFDGIVVSSTTDGGATWHDGKIEAANPLDAYLVLASVHFRDRLHGVLIDLREDASLRQTCESYASSDGGKTWSAAATAPCLGDVRWIDASHGYALTIDSRGTSSPLLGTYLTRDGGQTWVLAAGAPDCPNVYLTLPRADGSIREICGDSLSSLRVMSSVDDGRTWKTVGAAQGVGTYAPWISVLNQDLLIGQDAYLQSLGVSNDGGLTWTQVDAAGLSGVPTPFGVSTLPGGWAIVNTMITCPDTQVVGGIRSGGPCAVNGSALYSVADGGKTWTKLLTGPGPSAIPSASAAPSSVGTP